MAGWLQMLRGWSPLLVVVLTPLLLLPLPLTIQTSEARTAYAVFIMAVYWVSEAVPIAVTSLLPLVLFPLMDVVPAKVIAKSYMSDLLMVFLGGLLVAVAIERWNLHRRIALRILLMVGSEPRWLMLGMMLATWFLSMWISNTATTAMMVPIAEAVLQQLKSANSGRSAQRGDNNNHANNHTDSNGSTVQDGGAIKEKQMQVAESEKEMNGELGRAAGEGDEADSPQDQSFRLLAKGMSLSICYAANSGGIATLTGTGPNLVLKENADQLYADYNLNSPINFASWMAFGLPLSAIVLLVCWIWLQIRFLKCGGCGGGEEREGQKARVKAIVRQEYEKLGPMSFAEGSVLMCFITLVTLWITRDIGGVGGWGSLFPKKAVSDATPAILVSACLFFLPSRLPRFGGTSQERYSVNSGPVTIDDEPKRLEPLLRWSDAHAKVPWNLFLLLGGGFALSEGCKVSGLSAWVGEQLEVLQGVHHIGMLFVLCYITAVMTEVTSNTAICILLMPILSTLALRTGVHPLYYMIPSTLSCSFAFMLPVATPPNAIVFSYGHVRVVDMMVAGLVMNLVAVPILIMGTSTWGDAMFHFQNVPEAFLNASVVATS